MFNREQWKNELGRRGFYPVDGSHDDNLVNQGYYSLVSRLFKHIKRHDPGFDGDKFLSETDKIIDDGMA